MERPAVSRRRLAATAAGAIAVPFLAVVTIDATGWDPYLGSPVRLLLTGMTIWFVAGLLAAIAAGTLPLVHAALTTLYLTLATVARGTGFGVWFLGIASALAGGAFSSVLFEHREPPFTWKRTVVMVAAAGAIPLGWYAWTP